jgi:hypothetical protein
VEAGEGTEGTNAGISTHGTQPAAVRIDSACVRLTAY